jgi:hypothetical protein
MRWAGSSKQSSVPVSSVAQTSAIAWLENANKSTKTRIAI